MNMKVPSDLFRNSSISKQQISITHYVEHVPTTIHTQVQENLLVIVLKGKKRLVYQDYSTTVHAGEFALFKKGNYIMNQILSKDEYESILIFIDDEKLSSLIKEGTTLPEATVPYYKGCVNTLMNNEVSNIMELMQVKGQYNDILELKIMELLLYIQKNDSSNALQKFLESNFGEGDFKSSVQRCYSHCHSVDEMASEMNMSLSSFKRNFKTYYHCSPHEWVNNCRLQKAESLLMIRDYSVTDISFICGYDSLPTFMAQFKKKYGISPGRYRREKAVV